MKYPHCTASKKWGARGLYSVLGREAEWRLSQDHGDGTLYSQSPLCSRRVPWEETIPFVGASVPRPAFSVTSQSLCFLLWSQLCPKAGSLL